MTETSQIFYYSRNKTGLYLLFNLGLMALALIFTWSIFPDYKLVYYFALITCSLSIINSLFVYLMHLPAVTVSKEGIVIDHNQILKWNQIKAVKKEKYAHLGFKKYFLKIEAQKLENYKMGFMQRLTKNSKFGAFSVPLYAMDEADAKRIEKLIKDHTVSKEPSNPEKKVTIKKKAKPATAKKVTALSKAKPKTKAKTVAKSKTKSETKAKSTSKPKAKPVKKTIKSKKTSSKKGA